MGRAEIVLDRKSPALLKKCFASVFARLDACPRPILLSLSLFGRSFVLKGPFPDRWIPEHPVPLRLTSRTKLALIPTTGNRVKVRRATLWERIFK